MHTCAFFVYATMQKQHVSHDVYCRIFDRERERERERQRERERDRNRERERERARESDMSNPMSIAICIQFVPTREMALKMIRLF